MAKIGSDKVVTQQHRRAWSQRGGAGPENPTRYAGSGETYMMIDSDDNPPGRGSSDPINVPDPRRRKSFQTVGRSISAPDLPTATVGFLLRHGGVPWVDFGLDCPNNFYEVVGKDCTRPDDWANGMSDFVKIYSGGEGTSRSESNQVTNEDGDDASAIEVEFQFNAIYKLGALNFGEKAAPEVEREVVDVVYASSIECGNCGVSDDGTKRIYALTKSSGSGSPGTPAEIQYTIDGGTTWSQTNVTGLGGTVDPTGIEIVGNYLVVLDTAGNGYWYSELNRYTGAPGSWTNVTTGFVASKQPTDIYVISAGEVYFSANGGYIYRSTDIPSGVTAIETGNATTVNLQRISGDGEDVIIAVGESGKIVKSLNRGATWANTTTSPTSATIRALGVVNSFRFWIGTSGGLVYYTINGGETFSSAVSLPGGTYAVIDDIYVVTEEVIHISARTSTPTARLISTWNGGEKWVSTAVSTWRLVNFPTASRFNRIAAPRDVDPTTMGNYVAVGGLSGGGTDGALFLGIANKV